MPNTEDDDEDEDDCRESDTGMRPIYGVVWLITPLTFRVNVPRGGSGL